PTPVSLFDFTASRMVNRRMTFPPDEPLVTRHLSSPEQPRNRIRNCGGNSSAIARLTFRQERSAGELMGDFATSGRMGIMASTRGRIMRNRSRWLIVSGLLVGTFAVVLAGGWFALPGKNTPDPPDLSRSPSGPPPAGLHRATFGAGCFWCTQVLF